MHGSAFSLPLSLSSAADRGEPGALDPEVWALWARGGSLHLARDGGACGPWAGHVLAAHLGADARVAADLVTGVSVATALGMFDYTVDVGTELEVSGRYQTRLLSGHPYVGWMPAVWRSG